MSQNTTALPVSFWATSVGILGLVIGSFLNVVVYRLPQGVPLSRPGSHCPSCKAPIRWFDNIPLVSWLLLGGSCRSCHAPISVRYPLVEAATGALFATATLLVRPAAVVPAACALLAGLVAVTVTDIERMRIPTKIVYADLVVGAPLLVLASGLTGQWVRLGVAAASGAAAAAVFLALFFILPPGALGLGDVRLVGLQSTFLGWFGWRVALMAIAAGIGIGGVAGTLLLAFGAKKMKDKVAFGPFLAAGAVIAILAVHALPPRWTT